jgi:hypothetical protein
MLNYLQKLFRQYQPWIEFQEINREGWLQAWRRSSIQKLILKTSPIRTANIGSIEVRVLTWRRDWLNVIWALKSFYHFAEVDYPLFIHDGGLKSVQVQQLKYHFPDATIITAEDADKSVLAELKSHNLTYCWDYRQQNIATRKLFDFYLLSNADFVITIDSDIVFFKKPQELVCSPNEIKKNKYNKDMMYYYSMELDEIELAFGIRPISLINSGLSLVKRDSINFEQINEWLKHPKLFANKWVTEQTLHALCSTIYGVELLPDKYCVSTNPELKGDFVCKHYPGFFKTLLYEEGMTYLRKNKFIESLLSAKIAKSYT